MANNRIYLRCRNCGAVFFLGKCFGAEYYIDRYQGTSADLRDDLNAFYKKHSAWGCESATDEQKAKSLDE